MSLVNLLNDPSQSLANNSFQKKKKRSKGKNRNEDGHDHDHDHGDFIKPLPPQLIKVGIVRTVHDQNEKIRAKFKAQIMSKDQSLGVDPQGIQQQHVDAVVDAIPFTNHGAISSQELLTTRPNGEDIKEDFIGLANVASIMSSISNHDFKVVELETSKQYQGVVRSEGLDDLDETRMTSKNHGNGKIKSGYKADKDSTSNNEDDAAAAAAVAAAAAAADADDDDEREDVGDTSPGVNQVNLHLTHLDEANLHDTPKSTRSWISDSTVETHEHRLDRIVPSRTESTCTSSTIVQTNRGEDQVEGGSERSSSTSTPNAPRRKVSFTCPPIQVEKSNLNSTQLDDWSVCYTDEGQAYYYNELSQTSQWKVPSPIQQLSPRSQVKKHYGSLHDAVGKNYTTLKPLQIFLEEEGMDPNMLNQEKGQAPLHIAAFYGRLECLTFLHEKGADIDIMDDFERTAMFSALENPLNPNVVATLRTLVELGSRNDFTDAEGSSVVHHAVCHNNINGLRYLLESQLCPVNAKKFNGETPLHIASGKGFYECVELLLFHGGDFEAVDGRGQTPFTKAILASQVAIVQLLQTAKVASPKPIKATSAISSPRPFSPARSSKIEEDRKIEEQLQQSLEKNTELERTLLELQASHAALQTNFDALEIQYKSVSSRLTAYQSIAANSEEVLRHERERMQTYENAWREELEAKDRELLTWQARCTNKSIPDGEKASFVQQDTVYAGDTTEQKQDEDHDSSNAPNDEGSKNHGYFESARDSDEENDGALGAVKTKKEYSMNREDYENSSPVNEYYNYEDYNYKNEWNEDMEENSTEYYDLTTKGKEDELNYHHQYEYEATNLTDSDPSSATKHVDDANHDASITSGFQFSNHTSVSSLRDGKYTPWIQYSDENDQIYFYNQETQELQWEEPVFPPPAPTDAAVEMHTSTFGLNTSLVEKKDDEVVDPARVDAVWSRFFENMAMASGRKALDEADLNSAAKKNIPVVIDAVQRSNIHDLENALDSGISPDQVDGDSRTGLHFACQAGAVKMARILTDHGADVDRQDADGHAPLHLAALAGQVACVRHLLESAAAVDVTNGYGDTALHVAAWNGQLACVALLVEYGSDLEATNMYGQTPLTNVLTRSPVRHQLDDMNSSSPYKQTVLYLESAGRQSGRTKDDLNLDAAVKRTGPPVDAKNLRIQQQLQLSHPAQSKQGAKTVAFQQKAIEKDNEEEEGEGLIEEEYQEEAYVDQEEEEEEVEEEEEEESRGGWNRWLLNTFWRQSSSKALEENSEEEIEASTAASESMEASRPPTDREISGAPFPVDPIPKPMPILRPPPDVAAAIKLFQQQQEKTILDVKEMSPVQGKVLLSPPADVILALELAKYKSKSMHGSNQNTFNSMNDGKVVAPNRYSIASTLASSPAGRQSSPSVFSRYVDTFNPSTSPS